MRYLLDVNSLIAVGVRQHASHERVTGWLRRVAKESTPELATCSITELGFVRVLSHVQQYGLAVSQARQLLILLKGSTFAHFSFVMDAHDISRLPEWVKHPGQTTDGHLVELALGNDAQLATLDEKVPGAFLIPRSP